MIHTAHPIRIIFRNLKLGRGGIDKCLGGGVNIREEQIYILNHKKAKNMTLSRGGGSRLSTGGFYPPRGGVQLSLHPIRGNPPVNIIVNFS